jgi:hypothetical protein
MWDESGEFEEIRCPVCDADVAQGCEHIVLHVDVTFCQCIDGVARQIMPKMIDKIAEAFRGHLVAGRNPEWCHYAVQELWDDVSIDYSGDPTDVPVERPAFYDLTFDILGEAGGGEHQGRLVSSSGPYCESSVRLMYAQNPAEVCEKALPILDKYLVVEEPKPQLKVRKKETSEEPHILLSFCKPSEGVYMAKVHPNSGFRKFESHVEPLLEHLFAGFRRHKTQHSFTSVGKRPDFTLMSDATHRDRLIVDAKFCHAIGVREVKQVQGYKGRPFFAGRAAIVIPKNCQVAAKALQLAQEKQVMIVRVDARKEERYGIGRVLAVFPWWKQRGYKVASNASLSPEQHAQKAEWVVGPFLPGGQ